MMMSMNEKKILFAFGCPNRGLTVERLHHAATLTVDPVAKKEFFNLAIKLNEDANDDGHRNFFYNMRLEVERVPHHKYLPDRQPNSVEPTVRECHRSVMERIREQKKRSRRAMM